jgi:hypothetical protein
MGLKVSAAQASQLTGIHERTIRQYISDGRLYAATAGPRDPEGKAGPSRWAIDVDDLAALPGVAINREVLARIELARGHDPAAILARLEALERQMRAMQSQLLQLTGGAAPAPQLDAPTVVAGTVAPEVIVPEDIEAGSVLVRHFAIRHKVPAQTVASQRERKEFPSTPRPVANGRNEHWLSPAQQAAVIAYWERNHTAYEKCGECPHE